jgi:hypothetical protein
MYGGRARPPYSLLDSPREQLWEVCSMNRLLVKLTITAAAGGLLFSNPTVAQILPRLNRKHPETTFRVRMVDLKPQTTYYYKVSSMGADGESDGLESPVSKFTTPAAGERILAYPQPK